MGRSTATEDTGRSSYSSASGKAPGNIPVLKDWMKEDR